MTTATGQGDRLTSIAAAPPVLKSLPPRVLYLARQESKLIGLWLIQNLLFVPMAILCGVTVANSGFALGIIGVGGAAPLERLWGFIWGIVMVYSVLMTIVSRPIEWIIRRMTNTPRDASVLSSRLKCASNRLSGGWPVELFDSEPEVATAMVGSHEQWRTKTIELAGQIEGLDLVKDRKDRKDWIKILRKKIGELERASGQYERSIADCVKLNAMTSQVGRDMGRSDLIKRIPWPKS